MSVAEWDGLSFAELVERLKLTKEATAVLVSGWDHEVSISGRSIPGASWVFPLEWVKTMGAFLATGMNGQPLPDDHGAAVRFGQSRLVRLQLDQMGQRDSLRGA